MEGRIARVVAAALIAASLLAASLLACGSRRLGRPGDACSADRECEQGVCWANACLDPDGDDDGDGLANGVERNVLGTDPKKADTDGDHESDPAEVGPSIAAPLDRDGDGRIDAVESSIADSDGDCLSDEEDPTEGATGDASCPPDAESPPEHAPDPVPEPVSEPVSEPAHEPVPESAPDAVEPGPDAASGPPDEAPPPPAPVLGFAEPVDDEGNSTAGQAVFQAHLDWVAPRAMNVRVTSGGKPVAGAKVHWWVKEDPGGMLSLAGADATTGEDGSASLAASIAKPIAGVARVEAFLPDAPAVPARTFRFVPEFGACVPGAGYDVLTTIDLVTGLPPAAADVLYSVTGVWSDPTANLTKLFCAAPGRDAALDAYCASMFVDPSAPDDSALTQLGVAVRDRLAAIPAVWTGSGVPNHYTDALRNVQLLAAFAFPPVPGPGGAYGGVIASWPAVRLQWTYGSGCQPTDDSCGWGQFSFAQIPWVKGAPSVSVPATLAGASISFETQSLDIPYGSLVDFILEKWLLPNAIGDGSDGMPAVDSFEALLEGLLGGGNKPCLANKSCCGDFANAVSALTATDVLSSSKAACDALVTVGAGLLRDRLRGLNLTPDVTAVGPPSLTLASAGPCPTRAPEGDLLCDAFGAKETPCGWTAEWRIAGGSTAFKPKATYHGTKL
ncbi:MAG: hypothetical protein FJ087_09200 [Deltaproteobacteria bacterium]|nr:hypothetical protein [Deltaproteobacteria bacterium]